MTWRLEQQTLIGKHWGSQCVLHNPSKEGWNFFLYFHTFRISFFFGRGAHYCIWSNVVYPLLFSPLHDAPTQRLLHHPPSAVDLRTGCSFVLPGGVNNRLGHGVLRPLVPLGASRPQTRTLPDPARRNTECPGIRTLAAKYRAGGGCHLKKKK